MAAAVITNAQFGPRVRRHMVAGRGDHMTGEA